MEKTIKDPVTGKDLIVKKSGEAPPVQYGDSLHPKVISKELGKQFEPNHTAVAVFESRANDLGADSPIGLAAKRLASHFSLTVVGINSRDGAIKRDQTLTNAKQLLMREEMVERQLKEIDGTIAKLDQEISEEIDKHTKALYTSNLEKLPLRMDLASNLITALHDGASPFQVMSTTEGGRLMLHLREQFSFLLPENVNQIAPVEALRRVGDANHSPDDMSAVERLIALREASKGFTQSIVKAKNEFCNSNVISKIKRSTVKERA